MKALQKQNGVMVLADVPEPKPSERDGKLHSPISLRRPWTELPATMRELEKREYPGKAVLEVGGHE